MSLRNHVSRKYNRAQEKEEHHWTDLLHEEYDSLVYDLEWDYEAERDWAWFYMGAPFGYCNDVAEYQQMRLLTLLRKLTIATAREQAEYRGW